MTQHTATPWKVGRKDAKRGHVDVGTDDFPICTVMADGEIPEQAAIDAAHIVRCVNAHDDLVKALRNLIDRASSLDQSATHDGLLNCQALSQAQAAIQNATDTYPIPGIAKARA